MVGGNRYGIFAERKMEEKRIMTINMGTKGFEFDTIRHAKKIMTDEEVMQEVAATINDWYEEDFKYIKPIEPDYENMLLYESISWLDGIDDDSGDPKGNNEPEDDDESLIRKTVENFIQLGENMEKTKELMATWKEENEASEVEERKEEEENYEIVWVEDSDVEEEEISEGIIHEEVQESWNEPLEKTIDKEKEISDSEEKEMNEETEHVNIQKSWEEPVKQQNVQKIEVKKVEEPANKEREIFEIENCLSELNE
jgi:hypothetical protein